MDLNDALRGGYDIDSLILAASTSDPVLGVEWPKLAGEGIRILGEVVAAVVKCQGQEDAIRIIADLNGHAGYMRAVAAAHVLQPLQVDAALSRLKTGPKGISDTIRRLEAGIRRESEVVEQKRGEREGYYRKRVMDSTLKDLGIDGLVVPAGYTIDDRGVIDENEQVVFPAPMVLTGTSVDAEDGTYWTGVAWKRGGVWHHHQVDRGVITDSSQFAKLGKLGAPVLSATASQATKFLQAFEQANISKLPALKVIKHMGWHDDSFIVGDWSTGETKLRDESKQGLRYHENGTWQDWCLTVEKLISPYPHAMLAILASCAAPLLKVVGQRGFVVDWSGETSVGKTTCLLVAASVWGVPDDGVDGRGIVYSWRSSSTYGPMWLAWFNQSLPLILDETKRANSPELVGKMLFDIPAGQGTIQGNGQGSIREQLRWCTVMLSSGEAAITTFNKAGGAQARCIAVQGPPFPGLSKEKGKALTEAVSARLMRSYGHLGRRFVEYLSDRSRWGDIRTVYDSTCTDLSMSASSNVEGRVLNYVGVLATAATILKELGVPGDFGPAVQLAIDSVRESSKTSDMPTEAAHQLYRWACANEADFWKRVDGSRQPPGGWVGSWNSEEDGWRFIGMDPERTNKLLREWGYTPSDICRAWKDRGWYYKDAGGGNPKCGPGGVRLPALKKEHLVEE